MNTTQLLPLDQQHFEVIIETSQAGKPTSLVHRPDLSGTIAQIMALDSMDLESRNNGSTGTRVRFAQPRDGESPITRTGTQSYVNDEVSDPRPAAIEAGIKPDYGTVAMFVSGVDPDKSRWSVIVFDKLPGFLEPMVLVPARFVRRHGARLLVRWSDVEPALAVRDVPRVVNELLSGVHPEAIEREWDFRVARHPIDCEQALRCLLMDDDSIILLSTWGPHHFDSIYLHNSSTGSTTLQRTSPIFGRRRQFAAELFLDDMLMFVSGRVQRAYDPITGTTVNRSRLGFPRRAWR